MKALFLPISGGATAERLLRNRGRSRAFVARFLHWQLRRAYKLFLEGRWQPPSPRQSSSITVSLTSWTPRLADLPLVLLTLIQQTTRPREIVVWLTESDSHLLDQTARTRFKSHGVRIAICDDLKSHKKWLPMIESGHREAFVICDDDIVYPREWLARLLADNRDDAFVGLRAHRVTFGSGGAVAPYANWEKLVSSPRAPEYSIFITGGAGAIIHPKRIKVEFLDRSKILEKCPTADDVWLNVMHWGSGYACYKTRYSFPCLALPTAELSALERQNVGRRANDVQIAAVMSYRRDPQARHACQVRPREDQNGCRFCSTPPSPFIAPLLTKP